MDSSQGVDHSLNSFLQSRGYRTAAFASADEARHWLAEHQPNIIVVDGANGADADLGLVKELCPQSGSLRPLIFVVSNSSREEARRLMASGADDVVPMPLDEERFLARLEVHLHYHHALVQLQRRNELLSRLAAFDELTGLFNRRSFMEALKATLVRSGQRNLPVALFLIDIDHFKRINDTYGHHTGDEALRQMALCLAAPLRQEDVIGRYGGEEFCALIHNVDLNQALVVAERLRKTVNRSTLEAGGQQMEVTISLGVAWMPGRVQATSDELLRCADAALYEAKREGRNRVAIRDLESTRPGDCEAGPAPARG